MVITDKPSLQPMAASQRLPFGNVFAQAVSPVIPMLGDHCALNNSPSTEGASRALVQLSSAYARMVAAINLKLFNPDRIDEYIRRAEKRSGADMTDMEKDRLRRLAKTTDERVLRLLCLELRVGIPKKEEAEAERAFGQLLLARHDREALQRFMNDANADENLKAHVRAVLMLGQVEQWMSRYKQWKERLTPKIPFVFRNN